MDRSLIQKYLTGTLTAAEKAQFSRLMLETEQQELEAVMAEEWEKLGETRPFVDPRRSQQMWQAIQAQTVAAPAPAWYRGWWQVAAAIVLLLGLGLAFWQPWQQPTWKEVATVYGEQQQLSLPDGSVVYLNGNTRLRYQQSWEADETRGVWLDGEAYFEVADRHAEGIKFQVITEGLTVEVLGTEFNVNTGQKDTKVYLEKGKIQLKLDEQQEKVAVEPGELVTYSSESKAIAKREHIKATHHTSWKQGVLQFEATRLEEVLDRMEEIYGVQFAPLEGELTERQLTLAVPSTDLEIAMGFIEKALNLTIDRSGDTLLVR
jgi:ferric-dicitrate binding protein FerR (iron transport regulator)